MKKTLPRTTNQGLDDKIYEAALFKNEKQKRNHDEDYLQAKREEQMNNRYLMQ